MHAADLEPLRDRIIGRDEIAGDPGQRQDPDVAEAAGAFEPAAQRRVADRDLGAGVDDDGDPLAVEIGVGEQQAAEPGAAAHDDLARREAIIVDMRGGQVSSRRAKSNVTRCECRLSTPSMPCAPMLRSASAGAWMPDRVRRPTSSAGDRSRSARG